MIKNKLGARKCDVKFIEDRNLVNDFFDNNHIQDKTHYKYDIGLFYDNELDWWIVDGCRRHRFNYNKKKLTKMGGDPNMTEIEIMNDM